MGLSKGMDNDNEEKSESFCSRYLETFKELDSEVVELKVDKNYSQFEFLPELHCTMSQRPDVAIVRKYDQLTLLPVEVHSSPFSDSINKCMLGVIDLLRLHRAHSRDVSRCCGFVFPKLPGVKSTNKQCVVMVEVKWENLKFLCSFIPFTNIKSAQYIIASELSKAIKHSPRPGSPLNEMEKYVIRLSSKDLEIFGKGTMQVPSRRSILTRCDNRFFKHPVQLSELHTLKDVILPHSIELKVKYFPLSTVTMPCCYHFY